MRTQLLVITMCLAGCSRSGAASEKPPTNPEAPAELAVPADHKLVLMSAARGVQIYECAVDARGAPAWKLHAPRAELFDASGAPIGIHYGGIDKGLPAGPYWEAKDGSRIHGGKSVSVANPGSIPLLRLEASDPSGTGVLSKVAYVQRLTTTGGAAPAEACTAGKRSEVAYTAKYYFYAAP
jgi:Protein of unknown function (DUF3455)